MSTADAALARQRWQDARGFLRHHPEAGAAAVVVMAWAALVVPAVGGARMGSDWLGLARMTGMGQPGPAALAAWSQAADALPAWVLMTVAMMGPTALAGVRHVGRNSLCWRRRRAMAEFAAAYLLVWAAFGFLAMAAAARVPQSGQVAALGIAAAIAAAWQLTPAKRRALRGCHRSVPLPPRGWRAEAAAARFGLRNGIACLGSCWCMMLVMAVAPAGQLPWTAGLTAIVTAEKLLARPGGVTRAAAVALALAALAAMAAAAAHW